MARPKDRAAPKRRASMHGLLKNVFREARREPLLTLNLLRQYWGGVVGPEMAGKTHPRRLEKGVLWVAARDACWAYELQFFKGELLASVRTFLDSSAVNDLRFQTGEIPGKEESSSVPAAGTFPASLSRKLPEESATEISTAKEGSPAPGMEVPLAHPAARPAVHSPEIPPALARASQAIADPVLREAFLRSLASREKPPGGRPGKERNPSIRESS